MWEPIVVSVGVTLPLAMKAVGPRNFRYWGSYSTSWGAFAFLGTWLLLAVVSGAAVVTQRAATENSSWPADLAAAVVVHAVVRRPNSSDPEASSLLLGLLPTIFEWVDVQVADRIETWAANLSDDDLIAVAARLDDQATGGTRPTPFQTRVSMRDRLKELMAAGGSAREEACQQLVYMIAEGHVRYRLRKPPLQEGDKS